jgi:uncharacterized membrane protein SpoIIM required for sporulation
MIIDLQRFVAAGQPHWTELEKLLTRLEAEPNMTLSLAELTRFHELYERAAADLARITTFASEPATRRYLEHLVARAYGEIHETRERRSRLQPLKWFFQTLPQTFRRHVRAFYLAVAITLAGCVFGGLALVFDPESRHVTMAFGHDQMTPEERVSREEQSGGEQLDGQKTSFSAYLMTHNTKVSIFTLALGMTWGVGTIILLFYNGIIMGAISLDYILAGQTKFLLGWLMPHGVIEIPAILIAGQAGLVLAHALIGWGTRVPLTGRLRAISADLTTLIFGVALMLVWAGFVEAFLSQYHEPIIPYSAKIAFGMVEFVLLVLFLAKAGTKTETIRAPVSDPTRSEVVLESETGAPSRHENQYAANPHGRGSGVFPVARRAGNALSRMAGGLVVHWRSDDSVRLAHLIAWFVELEFCRGDFCDWLLHHQHRLRHRVRMELARADGR